MPNEDVTINSNHTSHITITSTEDETENTVNTAESTTQIKENQDQTSSTVDIIEETSNTIEYNIKHEISNPPFIPPVESRIVPIITDTFNPQLTITDTKLLPPEMDEFTAKIQKCCPSGQIMILGQPGEQSVCQESNEIFDIPVFYANLTHYWNYTTTAAGNVDIVPRDPCKQSKFFLDPYEENDAFRLLFNSSLYIPFSMDMLNKDQYCVDTIQGDETFTTAVICTAPPKVNIFHYFYITGLFISIISLVTLAIYSSQRRDIKDDHKKCLTYYAATMAIAYLFVAIHIMFHSYFNYKFSITVIYFIYYLKLKYYLWLNMLSYDTYRCVRDDTIDTISYMKWYLIVAFSVPFVFVVITFFDGFKPALPNLYLAHRFSSSNTFIICLYIVPIIVSTIGNIILVCCLNLPKERYTNVKDLIATFQSKDWKAPPKNIREIKKMYRRSLMLFSLVSISFILDIVIYFLPSTGKQQPHFMVRDIVYCLQGFFVSVIFIKKCWQKKNSRMNVIPPLDTELQQLNGNV